MIKNTLSDKSRNPETIKRIVTVRKLFNLCAHSWRGFAMGVLQVVLFVVL